MLHKAYIPWLWICQCYSRNSSIFCGGTLIIDDSLICKNRYMVWTHITFMNPESFQLRFLVHQPDTIKPRWPHHDLSLRQGCLIVTAWSQTSSWPESQAGLPYCDSMIPNLICYIYTWLIQYVSCMAEVITTTCPVMNLSQWCWWSR